MAQGVLISRAARRGAWALALGFGLAATRTRAEEHAATATPDSAGYEKGFYIQSGDAAFSLSIQGRLQARFSYLSLDAGAGEPREQQANFSVPRARLKLSGNAYTKALDYTFQADFGKGNVSLKDYYADYAFLPELRLRIGQFKRPFSRQHITSSGNLEFVDRSITDKGFGAGRDIGLMLHDGFEKSPMLEYALGLFNGDGEATRFSGEDLVDPETGEGEIVSGRFSNVPSMFEPALAGRVSYNFGGIAGYKEADFEGGPPRFALGVSALGEFDADNDDESDWRAQGDTIVKAWGASASAALYVASTQSGESLGDRSFAGWGFHAQGGYLIGKLVQPAIRYASVQPEGPNNNLQEATLGLSLYFEKHELKWQTDASLLFAEAVEDRVDHQLRTQLQLAF